MKKKAIACVIGAVFSGQLYAAQMPVAQAEIEPVVVTADRNAQTLDKAAPNVSVIGRKTLNQASAQNLDDIVMYEFGVSVPSDNNRRGHAGINIRGIDGNRILMMVDGVRIPESYAGGGSNGAISGRDMVESDTLKQVDIVKGPYSALYGSDALGGVVNMVTLSPSDFVDAGKRGYFGLKHSYRGRDRSHGVTATVAGFHENAEGLLMLTRRQGHETENMGSDTSYSTARTATNPQKNNAYNILAKGNIGNERHRLETLYEQYYHANDTVLANGLGSQSRGPVTIATSESNARDRIRRQRIEAGYRYTGEGRLKEANLTAYQQKLRTEDDAVDASITRMGTRQLGNSTRYSDYGFNQTIRGLNGRSVWEFDGAVKQTVVAGAEYKHTETARPRDSLTVDNLTGAVSKVYAGSTYPNKTFPDSKRKTFSVYAQDSLTFGNGIVLTPALRYEKDKLNTSTDQAYLNANPSGTATRFSDSAFTPSLRLSVPMGEQFTSFATYSQGFRTPPFDSATMAFANTTYGYAVIPNANLKSERSNSFELGMKFKNERTRAQVTAFYNRYRNFIDRTEVGTASIGGRPIIQYQYQNLDHVKTYGAEASAAYKFLPGWQVSGSIAWMRGKQQDGTPLDSAYPLNGVLGVDYAQEKWGGDTKLRWSKKHSRVSSDSIFQAPGYGVWDVGAWYKPSKNVEIGANIYNIGNKKYWQHADVAGMSRSSVMDLYTETGRNFAATVQLKF
ncbi:TonB-dependent hemoglobin/transferrin/lactoferrin family receptor [Neisseria sp. P0009.S001]|jgi:tonB-dependent hemoglobin/transferrin/lactoferrin receptor family protein|uniref:TonB-dependent hemoglobin/transferrin/lactoferrin receptor family protein n=2 Tax=Neisseria TaxID=482 RepID=A0A9W5IPR6_NEISU|nr:MULTISPECIES: TonB-dependent hemoglobin/transferrin/lactoferrin family receptor [Neisseria]OFR71587.1 TonB-dependent receptor [Neisseria sp. HMSC067G12]EFC51507.1 TonB-dependent hemoglobin/transferrin/lactoferrin receptor family protein [Neisseria subflava NJ9703]MCL5078367.1 TonB-dependent hemoglobin/transferrin/lactoferrin family receptor [Neisseria perflava]MDU6148208.1 TonB-dependent hemoglobin/transferrin/lactoferrin family receptor [Neisseria subflava]OFK04054.1 TonB-dependent recepto